MNRRMRWMGLGLILVSGLSVEGIHLARTQDDEASQAQISGRVVTADGKPLPRTMVVASGSGGGEVMALTDGQGHYTLRLAPGTYILRAEHPGYLTTSYKLENSPSEATPLTVRAGQHLSGIAFRLPKGGVITGRIRDEYGHPLIGAMVTVIPKEKQIPSTWLPFYTDDRGVYRIYGLPSGTYYVSVRAREWRLASFRGRSMRVPREGLITYYPGVASREEAEEVAVTEGLETTGIDFALKAEPSSGAKLFGRVSRADTGEPMPGVTVIAYEMERPVGVFLQAVSDQEGRYEINRLSSGKYMVRALSVMLKPEDGLAAPLRREVTVGREPVEVNFEFEPAGAISGRIVLDSGRIPEDVVNLALYLRAGEHRYPVSGLGRVTPHRDGSFRFDGIPGGVYHVHFDLGPTPYYLKSILLDDVDVSEEGIPVESGRETAGVVAILSDAGATLRGRVIGGKGPMPGAVVSLVAAEVFTVQEPRRVTHSGVVSDQHGRFEIKRIRPGRYIVFATSTQPARSEPEAFLEFLNRYRSQLQTVELRPNEIKELTLKPIVFDPH